MALNSRVGHNGAVWGEDFVLSDTSLIRPVAGAAEKNIPGPFELTRGTDELCSLLGRFLCLCGAFWLGSSVGMENVRSLLSPSPLLKSELGAFQGNSWEERKGSENTVTATSPQDRTSRSQGKQRKPRKQGNTTKLKGTERTKLHRGQAAKPKSQQCFE